jgi:hypothetical protein
MNKKCTVPMYSTGEVVRRRIPKNTNDCSEEILVPRRPFLLTDEQ